MPKVIILPEKLEIEVPDNTKLLVAARRAGAPIRFGCAACSCGTCAVLVTPPETLSAMKDNERELLSKMKLATDGSVRLSCQARIEKGTCSIDLDFQDTYSPEEGDD